MFYLLMRTYTQHPTHVAHINCTIILIVDSLNFSCAFIFPFNFSFSFYLFSFPWCLLRSLCRSNASAAATEWTKARWLTWTPWADCNWLITLTSPLKTSTCTRHRSTEPSAEFQSCHRDQCKQLNQQPKPSIEKINKIKRWWKSTKKLIFS